MRDTPSRSPEGEAIVKRIHCLIRKLNRPSGATIKGFVDPKIRGVVSDGH